MLFPPQFISRWEDFREFRNRFHKCQSLGRFGRIEDKALMRAGLPFSAAKSSELLPNMSFSFGSAPALTMAAAADGLLFFTAA